MYLILRLSCIRGVRGFGTPTASLYMQPAVHMRSVTLQKHQTRHLWPADVDAGLYASTLLGFSERTTEDEVKSSQVPRQSRAAPWLSINRCLHDNHTILLAPSSYGRTHGSPQNTSFIFG